MADCFGLSEGRKATLSNPQFYLVIEREMTNDCQRELDFAARSYAANARSYAANARSYAANMQNLSEQKDLPTPL